MRTLKLIVCLLLPVLLSAQTITQQLEIAITKLQADNQMKNAIISLYVINNKTGATVFDRNSQYGLAAASSQKVFTSIAALELLTKDYRYKTRLSYDGKIDNGTLNGNLYLDGSGDPTLGSWRYENTKEKVVLNSWVSAIKQSGIKQVNGNIIVDDRKWETQTIPESWIWYDIGNYYGAGISRINWRENQYDLKLKSQGEGEKVSIIGTEPKLYEVQFINELVAGKPGSGDNASIYLSPYSTVGYVRGTIPAAQSNFVVSGSMPHPKLQLANIFKNELSDQGITVNSFTGNKNNAAEIVINSPQTIYTHNSPPLDSIIYWFLKRSINLYGEALLKTIAFERKGYASTENGIKSLKEFWQQKGIESSALNIMDGSGLSPQNRVTTAALVTAMQYAKSKEWFNVFYNALPEINGLKMKSGSIGGARSFTGYLKNYTFAIIINNYSGSSGEAVQKMYKVLNILK